MVNPPRVSRRIVLRNGLLALGLAGAIAACSPVVDHRGYLPHGDDIKKVQPGMSKTEVQALLGSPSTTATVNFHGDSYYYISDTVEQAAFFKPTVVERQIFAVRFNQNDQVESFALYGLEDGRVIDFSTRQTPTRGKELTILQQLFSNVGKFSPDSLGGGGGRGPGGSIGGSPF
ncbi:outer membrane protein assembly factor BamE [Rhodoligotrophos defluvii]|uniref:outer membrane protein assembly factor BamE n=1 Tax=Rhodoligotrophos defluvii TaxID=2561934 RepID=UPI0010C9470B|nr:outer membrane protein assembly factor BamE [Rhodoligotrophos defluvii]